MSSGGVSSSTLARGDRSKVREEQQRGPELREGVDSQPEEGRHKYLMVTYC